MEYVKTTSGIIQTAHPECWTDGERMPRAKGKAAYRQEMRDELLTVLQPGDTVQCVLRHVSRSGMSRHIDFYKIDDGDLLYLSHRIATVLDYRQARDGSLVVGGCGMDMGFHVVYSLGCALWPQGTPQPHGTRNGEPDCAGGYALKYRWI